MLYGVGHVADSHKLVWGGSGLSNPFEHARHPPNITHDSSLAMASDVFGSASPEVNRFPDPVSMRARNHVNDKLKDTDQLNGYASSTVNNFQRIYHFDQPEKYSSLLFHEYVFIGSMYHTKMLY